MKRSKIEPFGGEVVVVCLLWIMCVQVRQTLAWTQTYIPSVPALPTKALTSLPSLGRYRRGVHRLAMNMRDDEEDDDEEDDDDDEDDDEPPEVDLSKFVPPTASYGLNRGRSSPSQRKAMGTSGSSTARIHICSSCGSEAVKWMGRCPTCKEWNTFQEHAVQRESQSSSSSRTRPVFGKPFSSPANNNPLGYQSTTPASWLDGTIDPNYAAVPVRITDLYDKDGKDGSRRRPNRMIIPNDQELNTVLGGGIMRGSLTLIGGGTFACLSMWWCVIVVMCMRVI
jgi:hypothetical protein